MTITEARFSLCPAGFQVLYTDDNGDNKYAYAFGMGTCYICADYTLKRFAMKQKKHTVKGNNHEQQKEREQRRKSLA